jgi:hypothetical protein
MITSFWSDDISASLSDKCCQSWIASVWCLLFTQAALPQGIVPFVFSKEYNLHPDVLSTAYLSILFPRKNFQIQCRFRARRSSSSNINWGLRSVSRFQSLRSSEALTYVMHMAQGNFWDAGSVSHHTVILRPLRTVERHRWQHLVPLDAVKSICTKEGQWAPALAFLKRVSYFLVCGILVKMSVHFN